MVHELAPRGVVDVGGTARGSEPGPTLLLRDARAGLAGPVRRADQRARAAWLGSANVGDERGECEPDHGDHEQRGEQSPDTAVHVRSLLSRVVVGACATLSPL